MIFKFPIAVLLMLMFSCNGQTQGKISASGEANARGALKQALSDTTMHNVVGTDLLLKDKETAIKIAEPLLFSIYGRNNIKEQRPYETYLIDNYWIISGTLPEGRVGGTFLIIIDGTNSKIIRPNSW